MESAADTAIRRIRWQGERLRGQPLEMTRLGFASLATAKRHLHDPAVLAVLGEVYDLLKYEYEQRR